LAIGYLLLDKTSVLAHQSQSESSQKQTADGKKEIGNGRMPVTNY
jgi:hypothetical protein